MRNFKRYLPLLIFAAGMATAVFLLNPKSPPTPQIATFLLLAIWPTLAWMFWTRGTQLTRFLTATAVALLLNLLLVLLVSYLPGPVSRTGLLLLQISLIGLPCMAAFTKKREIRWNWSLSWPLLVLILLLLITRLPHVGYSEFQGDEGVVMLRAAAILAGDADELFIHQKGPVEIIMPMTFWQTAGMINELWARSLFSWANMLAVLAIYLLVRQWAGKRAAFLAGIFFVLVGFALAFGRIVQYQSFVVLWGALALIHATRYRENGKLYDIVLASAFLAGGLLAHYDAILVLPALIWLVGSRWWHRRQILWRDGVTAVVAGTLLLAIFYVPFVTSQSFARTAQYLLQGRLGVDESGAVFSWSGAEIWRMVTFYNSTYFIILLLFLLVWGIWQVIHQRRYGAALLYFGTPLLFYIFIVADPRTHVYTFFPGGVILAAVGAAAIGRSLQKRSQTFYRFAQITLGLILVVQGLYLYLMFIDHTPERQRTWTENRPLGFWVSWDDPPAFGLFGFPHQSGWRLANDLIALEDLPYGSNEEEEITHWYMGYAPRSYCNDINSFVFVEQPWDGVPYDAEQVESMFVQDEVWVNGRLTLQSLTTQPPESVTTHQADTIQLWRAPQEMLPPTYTGSNAIDKTLGNNQVRLLGYDLSHNQTEGGEELTITLYWQALQPFDQNYQVFVHLLNNDELRVQHDGAPQCDFYPTTHWEPGEIIADTHMLVLPTEVDPNDLSLHIGMYNLITQDRLLFDDSSSDKFALDLGNRQ